jgi:hypothetical protein
MSHAKHAEPKHRDEKTATGIGAVKKKLRTGVKAGLGPDNVQKKHVSNVEGTP